MLARCLESCDADISKRMKPSDTRQLATTPCHPSYSEWRLAGVDDNHK
jgi:hypothetical protein